jgi:hypothetical protein
MPVSSRSKEHCIVFGFVCSQSISHMYQVTNSVTNHFASSAGTDLYLKLLKAGGLALSTPSLYNCPIAFKMSDWNANNPWGVGSQLSRGGFQMRGRGFRGRGTGRGRGRGAPSWSSPSSSPFGLIRGYQLRYEPYRSRSGSVSFFMFVVDDC